MKAITKILSLGLITACAALSSCTSQGGGAASKGDYLLYDRENYISEHNSLRTLGMGYAAEDYTRIYTDKGSFTEVTDVKALVVPVDFTDFPASSLRSGSNSEELAKKDIEDAVFGEGESERLPWESLKSYYEKSSFGECHIEGKVTDWYHTGKSVTQFAANGTGATQTLCKAVTKWAVETQGISTKDYDANGDGYIDSIIMIYSCPPHVQVKGKAVNDDLYWAFCSSSSDAGSNKEDPSPYRFFWASYKTFFENGPTVDGKYKDWTDEQIKSGVATIDSHTLIHEFGHVLSLPDLYNGNYDLQGKNANAYDPTCGTDMMSYNVGDHNAWSKALYGWVAPYVVYGDATITLKSTTDTGNFIALPAVDMEEPDREFTLLSQFVMLEFLTPTGVAKYDGEHKFSGNYPLWYKEAGVRATLIDARPGRFAYGGGFEGFTAAVGSGTGYYVNFACNNNDVTRSCFETYKICELIPNSDTDIRAKDLRTATDENLYHEGDRFNLSGDSVWKDFKVDSKDGYRNLIFNYGFEITEMDETQTTIKITKVHDSI